MGVYGLFTFFFLVALPGMNVGKMLKFKPTVIYSQNHFYLILFNFHRISISGIVNT